MKGNTTACLEHEGTLLNPWMTDIEQFIQVYIISLIIQYKVADKYK